MPGLGVTLPVEDGLSAPRLVELFATAERLGYDTALCGEVSGVEVPSILAAATAATERIRLGSGIVPTTTRSPALTAMAFATLSSLAPGRVVAGLGASSPIVVGRWHGLPFDRPLATTREFIEVFRAAMAGEKVDYDGEMLSCHGFRLGLTPGSDVPVWLAAINDRMLELAGEVADGVFLTWCPPDEVAGKLERVRAGAERAGRSLDDLEVILSFWCYAGDRPDVAMDRLRRAVLAYAMVPTHQHAFVNAFPGLAAAADAWASGDRREALRHVGDDVVEHFCAIGAEATAERVAAYHAAGVHTPLLLLKGAAEGDDEGPEATMRALAPS